MRLTDVPLSPIATQVPRRTDAITKRKPWGFLLHTTGRGIPEKAKREGKPAIDVALAWYRRSQNGEQGYPWGGPGYVIDHVGAIYQIADDDTLTNHAGGPDREKYLNGSWQTLISAETLARWRAKWPRYSSPQALYPSRSANTDFVGCELIPVIEGGPAPLRPGLLFTEAQHDAAVSLARDLAARHAWPAGWSSSPRLLGHEDVQPIQRHDTHGGWDPGWLRAAPFFDFARVRARVESA